MSCKQRNMDHDKESLVERRDNELEVLQAIYMEDFQDIREKVLLKFIKVLTSSYKLILRT